MSYQPYEPGRTEAEHAYEPYVPPTAASPRPTRPARPHHRPPAPATGSGRQVLGGVLAAISIACSLGALAAGADDDPAEVERDRYTACAAEHDETRSLFSDAEWCDLELNGGDG